MRRIFGGFGATIFPIYKELIIKVFVFVCLCDLCLPGLQPGFFRSDMY